MTCLPEDEQAIQVAPCRQTKDQKIGRKHRRAGSLRQRKRLPSNFLHWMQLRRPFFNRAITPLR